MRYGTLHHHERILDMRAATCTAWSSGSRRRGASSGCARPGWCRSPSGRSSASTGRSRRSTDRSAWCSSPSWSPTRTSRRRRTTRGWPRCSDSPLDPRGAQLARHPRDADPPHPGEPAARGGGDGPRRARRQRRRKPDAASSRRSDWARLTSGTLLQPDERLRRHQVRRLRLVEPAHRCRRCATRSTRRSPRSCAPAGTAGRRTTRGGRRVLGRRGRRDRRRPDRAAGRAVRLCSTSCRPVGGPSSEPFRPRG